MLRDPKQLAFVTLVTAGTGWSLSPVFLRIMGDAFDPFTVSLARYGIGCVPLLAVSLLFFREGLRETLRNPWALLALAAMNLVMQYTWTVGCYGSNPTAAQLITRITVLFTIVFSFFLFREERAVIRSVYFALGTALSLGGLTAVLMSEPGSAVPVVDATTIFLVVTALCWSIYNVSAKHLVKTVHPIPMYTTLCTFTAIGYLPIAVALGEPADLFRVDGYMTAITVASALIPIALSHPCYNFAQKYLGSSYCSTFILFSPAVTYLGTAALIPGETLLAPQIIGGVVLIGGTACVTVARRKADRLESGPADTTAEAIDPPESPARSG